MKQFPRWTIILRQALLAVAVAATAMALAYVEEDVRGALAWKRFVKVRAAEGQPLDYDFYMPPRIPEAENLFKAHVLVQLYRFDSPETKKFQKDTHNIFDFWKAYGHWQAAAPTNFPAAYAVLEKNATASGYPGDKAAAALVLSQFDAVKPVIDEIRDAAAARPLSQMGLNRNGSVQGNASGTLHTVSYALAWRGSCELELGQYEAAYRDTYANLRLIEGPLSVPTPLHLVFGMQIASRSLQSFWEGCWKGAWDERQLTEFQSLLSGLRPLERLPAALRMETAVVSPDPKYLPRWMPSGWAPLSIIAHAEYEARFELTQFDPVSGRISLEQVRRSDQLIASQVHSVSPITRLAVNMTWRRVPNIATEQCAFVLAQTACALERYRIDAGRYPPAISDLVPRYMASVPNDVIDGSPLRYVLGADGRFTLYSIGMNGIDDHGTLPASAKAAYYPWSLDNGDWVWRQPLKG
jgi:hypothetical protein